MSDQLNGLVFTPTLTVTPTLTPTPIPPVIIEEPALHPTYTTCTDSYWYILTNDRGHPYYLTLNANLPEHSTNWGEWKATLPQPGIYKVEAYIPGHAAIKWCTGSGRTIQHDTASAQYTLNTALGVESVIRAQTPLSNTWLSLGDFYFTATLSSTVSLSDMTSEAEFTTTVSFSALRFSYLRPPNQLIYLPLIHRNAQAVPMPPLVGVFKGQGFDTCNIPSLSAMQTWWDASPYHLYNVYLGGVSFAKGCTLADAAWVSAIRKQGWAIIPTWVGPQAACSNFKNKMSSDPAVAYQQGRAEAEAASAAAMAVGLAEADLSGSILYYDLEGFGGASLECRLAAKSFIDGWVERLHELGSLGAAYGASCTSYPTDWASIAHVPDDVWVGAWYTDTYDPNASVFNALCLSDALWADHQRLRQYAGDHSESWGGRSIAIDSNAADGQVLLPAAMGEASDGSPETGMDVTIQSSSVQDVLWLDEDTGYLIYNHRLYASSDGGITWRDISPALPIERLAFLPSGEGWVISGGTPGSLTLYHTPTAGAEWQALPLPRLDQAYTPLDLRFSDAQTGSILLRQVTSSAFNQGVLLKTEDGGLSWQVTTLDPLPDRKDLYEMPLSLPVPSEQISLQGSNEAGIAWVVSQTGECQIMNGRREYACQQSATLYLTSDDGETWKLIALPDNPED